VSGPDEYAVTCQQGLAQPKNSLSSIVENYLLATLNDLQVGGRHVNRLIVHFRRLQ